MTTNTDSDLFADLEYGIGDAVAVLPDVRGGHRQGGDRAVAGVVTNVRKDNCVFQYLVDVVDGGRNWYDAKCVVDVEQTGIYAHMANGGLPHCSYDAPRVGTLYYRDGKVLAVDIEIPDEEAD